jgi:citrate synthase
MMDEQQGPLHQSPHAVASQDPTATVRKSVGFVSRITFRKHISRRDMTPEEIQSAWYSREECAAITKSCCKQIHMLNQGERLRDTKYCARGLESHTRICLAAKLQNRADAFRAVLAEQDNQLTGASVVDDEAVRKAYQGVSNSAQLWAQIVGLQDEREAEDVADEFLYSSQTSTIIRNISTCSPPQEPLQASIFKTSSCSSLPVRSRLLTGVLALLQHDVHTNQRESRW